jgi:V/A-type H+-transporting ATPase subunit D
VIQPDQAPTRAVVLELRAERSVVQEAYDFLDEKRLLLAAELVRQINRYESLNSEIARKSREARASLLAAVKRHGLQDLGVYPSMPLEMSRVETSRRNLMGVTLLETAAILPESAPDSAPFAVYPTAEAVACRDRFREVFALGTELAGVSGNLYRLFVAYRSTERRARALENIILPEIEQQLNKMSTSLEEMDMEDAIRARSLLRSGHAVLTSPPEGRSGC